MMLFQIFTRRQVDALKKYIKDRVCWLNLLQKCNILFFSPNERCLSLSKRGWSLPFIENLLLYHLRLELTGFQVPELFMVIDLLYNLLLPH